MNASNSNLDAVPARRRLPPRAAPNPTEANHAGHPLRRKRMTFVTHEVEVKRPFGLPNFNALLERAGLRKPEQDD